MASSQSRVLWKRLYSVVSSFLSIRARVRRGPLETGAKRPPENRLWTGRSWYLVERVQCVETRVLAVTCRCFTRRNCNWMLSDGSLYSYFYREPLGPIPTVNTRTKQRGTIMIRHVTPDLSVGSSEGLSHRPTVGNPEGRGDVDVVILSGSPWVEFWRDSWRSALLLVRLGRVSWHPSVISPSTPSIPTHCEWRK